MSITLIINTIKLTVTLRRNDIQIMKYIGATDFFIRAPFVVEGILIGALGSVLPIGILYFFYGEVIKTIKEQFESIFQSMKFLERNEIMGDFIPLALVFSLGIGLIASYVTARRQIRKIELQH